MRHILLYLVLLCVPVTLWSQTFRLMRFDEDYAGLKDSAKSFYNQLKYLPLSAKSNKIYLSAGGEARAEFVYFENEDWGRIGIGSNPFLLQRYNLHADFHLGEKARFFGQLRSAWESGRNNGPRPIDEDNLNIQNLFIDLTPVSSKIQKLTVRVGRQELNYGSGRLLSVSEGPNLRRYFDGAKLMYKKGNLSSDLFVMAASTVLPGAFDNTSTRKASLWGVYHTLILPKNANLEIYYLGVRRGNVTFDDGDISDENRHSLGGRLWRSEGGFIYNIEGVYQFGKFNKGTISAWTASADIGYMFENVKGSPSINLRHDYISGDKEKGDGKLGTFNPLYPKGGYFGFNPQIGPVNLIDIHPYATYNINHKMVLQADVVFNWRYALQDGVYRPSGTLNLSSSGSKKRYIGTGYLLGYNYNINRFLVLNAGAQYFRTGAFIEDVIAESKDGVFINSRIVFKF
jgi:hypothetical protein